MFRLIHRRIKGVCAGYIVLFGCPLPWGSNVAMRRELIHNITRSQQNIESCPVVIPLMLYVITIRNIKEV